MARRSGKVKIEKFSYDAWGNIKSDLDRKNKTIVGKWKCYISIGRRCENNFVVITYSVLDKIGFECLLQKKIASVKKVMFNIQEISSKIIVIYASNVHASCLNAHSALMLAMMRLFGERILIAVEWNE